MDLEDLVDNAIDLHLARVKVVDGGGELVHFREASENGDLVTDCEYCVSKSY